MKKSLFSLVAFMLSATAMNAQQYLTAPQQYNSSDLQVLAADNNATAKKAPSRAAASNQKYFGTDGTDEARGLLNFSKYASSVQKLALQIPASALTKYIGCKIVGMRCAVYNFNDKNITGFALPMTQSGFGTEVSGSTETKNCTVSNNKLVTVWNEIKFSKSITIAENTDFIVGFNTPNKNMTNVAANNTSGTSYSLMAYGNLGQGMGWYPLSQSVTIIAQILIEKEGGFPNDFAVEYFHVAPYGKASNAINAYAKLNNFGKDKVQKYTLGLYVNGNKVSTYDNSTSEYAADFAVDDKGVLVSTPFTLPANVKVGENNTVTVKVETVDGKAPVGNLKDDEGSDTFLGFDKSIDRQKSLIEQYTSQYCPNCPIGYDVLRALTKEYPNDYAWVANHGDMSTSMTDEYTTAVGNVVRAFAYSGYPSVSVNRYYIENEYLNSANTVSFGLNYGSTDDAKDYVKTIIRTVNALSREDAPAFVTLNIKPTFDMSTGKLTFTVKGQGVANAAKLLKGATLTTYLTQDGLKSDQINSKNEWMSDYAHENVLRDVIVNAKSNVTKTVNPAGDVITWNGDNFEMTYEYTVNKEWYAQGVDKLRLTAFVSMPFWDGNTAETSGTQTYVKFNDPRRTNVNQCQVIHLSEGVVGVQGVKNNTENVVVVARYNADGQQINAAQKGLNILKMSDGTVRKVLVK